MELPLGLSDAVTHLSYSGGLSGSLHFSQSLLALVLAKGLPEFLQEFRSVASGLLSVLTPVPELVRCLYPQLPYRMRTSYSSSIPPCLCLQSHLLAQLKFFLSKVFFQLVSYQNSFWIQCCWLIPAGVYELKAVSPSPRGPKALFSH